ncbi:unnamed protein product [Moneuplotes crassus]|uniref:Secreted protein n=1 Tax=Euplotes crassus TaxID=5936 RepID=A0AAD1XPN7_EUPCR|nr:unnamed protein product [Moneuplotes crassus]
MGCKTFHSRLLCVILSFWCEEDDLEPSNLMNNMALYKLLRQQLPCRGPRILFRRSLLKQSESVSSLPDRFPFVCRFLRCPCRCHRSRSSGSWGICPEPMKNLLSCLRSLSGCSVLIEEHDNVGAFHCTFHPIDKLFSFPKRRVSSLSIDCDKN